MLGSVDLLVSPTEEAGKVLAAFAHIHLGGRSDLINAIQIAQLALKHRKNKNGAQRIIAFVGSPVAEAAEALAKLGKQLKKNNVALDLVNMGETDENSSKLQELINAVNSGDNSHLITVPAGVSPANALLSSPVMHGVAAAGGGAGDNFDMYGGIDPSMDPELAMAIRASTEEARAQEEARQRAAGGAPAEGAAVTAAAQEDDSEEALMQRALEMSMRDYAGEGHEEEAGEEEDEAMDEDEELARALAMSVEDHAPPAASSSVADASSSFADPDFVHQLLASSDLNDPIVQAALAQLQAKDKKAAEEGEEGEEKSRKRKNDT